MEKKNIQTAPINIDQKLKEIGGKVKSRRKAINKNYVKFASEHNINRLTLYRIENGENFKMSSLLHVLNALGTTIEEILE